MKRDTIASDIPSAAQHFDQLPDSAGVDVKVVATLFGVSTGTVWRWAKAGRLRKPRHFGPNTTRFLVGDLRHAKATMCTLEAP